LYDSFHDLMRDARANVEARQAAGYGWPDSDAGNSEPTPCDEIMRQSVRGIQSLTDAAMRTFDDIDSLPIAPRGRARIVPGMAGRPDIPAVLAGSPAWARRVIRERAHVAPIRVIVDITATSDANSTDRARRGAIIAAACRIIAASRPVELHFVAMGIGKTRGKHTGIVSVRVDTAPLEVAHTAWLSGSHSAFREVMMVRLFAIQGQRMDDRKTNAGGMIESEARAIVADTFGADAVFIPRLQTFNGSPDCQVLADPKGWLASFVAANQ
jgi:hypothetical protein